MIKNVKEMIEELISTTGLDSLPPELIEVWSQLGWIQDWIQWGHTGYFYRAKISNFTMLLIATAYAISNRFANGNSFCLSLIEIGYFKNQERSLFFRYFKYSLRVVNKEAFIIFSSFPVAPVSKNLYRHCTTTLCTT